MSSPKKKYVCIHGHFYQPPRENPWLEAVEREPSAAPYHDWNERINMECYRANTAARLVDDKNQMLNLTNNYKYFSFNFGPTLIQWIEKRDPWAYRTILEADRQSCETLDGHGNALAQVYNHIIMPLASQRDKITQVRWGIGDFVHRFGRRPEGMWLAETAVDRKTLSILVDEGIKFTILSPYQAARWRFLAPNSEWRDAANGSIPTGRAYRYDCGGGRYVHLFFYDPALARGIAFERLLEHSSKLLRQIQATSSQGDQFGEEPWLVNVATDGESYGHHFKFGDMALAAAFQELQRDPSSEIVNYAYFLDSFPVVAEAEIFENTAWSCAHGLGRWSADCGCHIGGEPGWNQKWRAPLRKALDYVRDRLVAHFEESMKRFCKDPWQARNDYISVIVDRKEHLAGFLSGHFAGSPGSPDVSRFLKLLEMQRFSLLMYTSCGWFFDEISQLEPVLIMKYAAMAMALAEETGAAPIEPGFLEILRDAPSNLAEFENGADVFRKKVKPEFIRKERVAANYAIQSLARYPEREFQSYTYSIFPEHEEDLGSNPVPCLFGHLGVRDDRTLDREDFLYTVVHFGGMDFRCWVKPFPGMIEYGRILSALQNAVEQQNTTSMVRILDAGFGTGYFGLDDVFGDLRSTIALEISGKALSAYTELQKTLFHTHKPLIMSLKKWGIKLPADLRISIRRVLSDEARQLVESILLHEEEQPAGNASWFETDFFFRAHMARLTSLLDEVRSWGMSLKLETVSARLGTVLVKSVLEMTVSFSENEAGRFFRLLTVCVALGIHPETWKLQTLYYGFVTRGVAHPELRKRIKTFDKLLDELDGLLWCRFALLLESHPEGAGKAPPACAIR
ncbi:MAG: DUF3536 domain-containing protein [Desulfobacteraceae bacterium]|nr:DUF3536 domain-containing protein [Desulfobacteraceae bacterium]